MKRLAADQVGSVSPVFMTLIFITMLLMMLFLDREWVNYSLKRLEQTADFAAEAGARNYIAYATVKMTRTQVQTWHEWVCTDRDEHGECLEGYWEPYSQTVWDYQSPRRLKVADLKERWRELFHCQDHLAYEPAWQCYHWEILSQEVEFRPDTEELARQTFQSNWRDRPAARVSAVWITAMAGQRKVTVMADVRLGSLFGLWPRRTQIVQMAAVSQLEPLVLQ